MADFMLIQMVLAATRDWDTAVDYGCGDGQILTHLDHIPHRYGLDLMEPEDPVARKLWIRHDIREEMTLLDEIDGVQVPIARGGALLLDAVEHLERVDAERLLFRLMRQHSEIVVFTPLGFMEHHGTEENPFLEHLSGWDVTDFEWCQVLEVLPFGGSGKSIFAHWSKPKR